MSIRKNRHQREPVASARQDRAHVWGRCAPNTAARGDVVGQPLVVRVVSRAAEEGAA